MRRRFGRKRSTRNEIFPDEILIDSENLAEFDRNQFEGRLERPLSGRLFYFIGGVMFFFILLLGGRAGDLQIAKGAVYAEQAKQNQLEERVIVADRGIIADRNGMPLAYNERANADDPFAKRVYAELSGLSHVVGFVKPPQKDASGNYYREVFTGMDGAEKAFDAALAGQNGKELTETDAHGTVVSQSVESTPEPGQKITLSIDAGVTEGLFNAISNVAKQSNFQGGAGVIIDVKTGEILALTSYPDYSSQALSDGDANAIDAINNDPHRPFLNRAVNGLYSPGSIVKPVMAIAALTEGVISPDKQILSTGSISLPNPYDPEHPSVFKDWRANGWVDVRHAIAVSSDVYFYEVGGGFQGQPGLGIDRIDKYLKLFGFGAPAGLEGFTQPSGVISSIAWKEANFPGDQWRIGDTYHTAIGQYGTQVTPLQAAREAAAIANGGKLLTPTLLASSTPKFEDLALPAQDIEIVREGMRLGVTEGIAQSVSFPYVHVAAKTGTAQVGVHNEFLNSWMIGFWPYENPRYAYAVVLERGPAGTLVGSPAAVSQFLQWMESTHPSYLTTQ